MTIKVINIGSRRYQVSGKGLQLLPMPRNTLDMTNPTRAIVDPEVVQQKMQVKAEKAIEKEAKEEISTIMEELAKVSLSLRGSK